MFELCYILLFFFYSFLNLVFRSSIMFAISFNLNAYVWEASLKHLLSLSLFFKFLELFICIFFKFLELFEEVYYCFLLSYVSWVPSR